MHRFFISLYYLIKRNRIITVFTALLMSLVCFFFISKIKFEEDITQIIPKSEKSDITAKILKQLNFSDKIIVIIENKSKNTDFQLSETADAFFNKIQPLEKYIGSVQGKVNDEEISKTFDFVNENLPLFLDENDYKAISQKINKDSIAKQVESNYVSLVSPTSLVTKEFIKKRSSRNYFFRIKKNSTL